MVFGSDAHRNYSASSAAPQNNDVFYNYSPKLAALEVVQLAGMEKLEQIHVEPGWLLTSFMETPMVWFHRQKDSKDPVLCNKTFSDGTQKDADVCPACAAFNQYKEIYGDDRAQYPIKAAKEVMGIPFLATRRQHTKHLTSSNKEILPIYWLSLPITSYIEEEYKFYCTLRDNAAKYPFDQTPYVIGAKPITKMGNTGAVINLGFNYYVQPYNAQQINDSKVVIDHPILRYRGYWTPEYFQMIQYLFLARFKAYVDPQTGLAFEYGGHLAQARQMQLAVRSQWPKPVSAEPVALKPTNNYGMPM